MSGIIRYFLLTASRDWLFVGLFLALIAASTLSMFLGSTALSEQLPMQLSFAAASTRMILTVGIVLFICFNIRKAFENREIEYTISRPISRSTILIAYFLSFSLLAFLLTMPVVIFFTIISKGFSFGIFAWGLSVYLEVVLLSTFAILASLILRSAVISVLACYAFYIISRLMGFAVSSIIIPANINNVNFNGFLELVLKGLSILLPRLDQFGQSKWLVYGEVTISTFSLSIIQVAIYIPLILLMSVIDFNRKEF